MSKRTCAFPGCDRPYYALGYCNLHWRRQRANGDPGKVRVIRNDPLRRFWSYVNKTPGCWLWTGKVEDSGYGRFWTGERTDMAHRYAYTLLVGPIPEGYTIDHVKERGCTSKACVKAIADEHGPAHLEPVTYRENNLRGDCWSGVNARKTHCPQGHPYDATNTYWWNGWRHCRTCMGLRLL